MGQQKRSKRTKGWLCMLQNAVHNTNHPETRTSRIESVFCNIVGKKNSEHGFIEFG